ncbi:SIR2 family protein [Actinomycetospora sp. TBRC 11914]|uniref:SIR2 family NAD-dependent protein deacylase n=1 Tax=Actinomycetospora sp. TBRC 11914 TaxID=2729387 RepID=UPI00145DF6D7|nr:SIR2 family protein [Actinomycetospora sp. TBRC 11914]NMO88760.1 SIR2 family protein [Actinomycetospora sp. TBRC 11914]
MTRGHVFVVHGDLTQLACDDVVVPTDARGEVSASWHRLVPPGRAPWGEGIWPVDTGSGSPQAASWYATTVHDVLDAVAADQQARPPRRGRSRHLTALPLVGAGRGAAGSRRGDVIAAVLEVLETHADEGHDVALVLRSGRDHAAAQHVRRGRTRHGLSPAEEATAEDLAARARVNELALFLGAGVSVSAGLPSWAMLLDELARRAAIPAAEAAELRTLPAQDAATLIERTLDEPLEDALAAVLSTHRHGLSHALLAALPMWEAATTNYDDLFERALGAVGRAPAVLPFEPARADRPYLLKLHGDLARRRNVVLTRDHYLRFQGAQGALAGVVQGLLMTRHVLFAGFSLADENFLHLADEVRRVREDDRVVGTALALVDEPLRRRMWDGELRYQAFAERPADRARTDEVVAGAARRMEIFLDLVAHHATDDASFLLDERYQHLLTPAERAFTGAVTQLRDVPPGSLAGRRVEALLHELGMRP